MNITYESQGTMTYGVYQIQPNDVLDTLGLGMLTNNKIPGLAATQFTQMTTSAISSSTSPRRFPSVSSLPDRSTGNGCWAYSAESSPVCSPPRST